MILTVLLLIGLLNLPPTCFCENNFFLQSIPSATGEDFVELKSCQNKRDIKTLLNALHRNGIAVGIFDEGRHVGNRRISTIIVDVDRDKNSLNNITGLNSSYGCTKWILVAHEFQSDDNSNVNIINHISTAKNAYQLWMISKHNKTSSASSNNLNSDRVNLRKCKHRCLNNTDMTDIILRVMSPSGMKNNSDEILKYLDDTRLKYIDTEFKLNLALLVALKQMLNFQIQFVTIEDGLKNKSNWEYVRDNEVDWATDFIQLEAIDSVDFVMPTYPFKKSFILQNPQVGGKSIFLQPFSSHVWYCLIALGILNALLLKLLLIIDVHSFNEEEDNSFGSILLVTISMFCQQGSTLLPHLIAGKIFIFNLLLLSSLSYNYYTSVVVSSLLSNPPPYITSIDELEALHFRLGIEPDLNTNQDVTIKLFQHKNPMEIYFNYSTGFDKMRKGGFAYYTEPNSKYSYLKKAITLSEICKTIELEATPTTYKSVVLPKNFKYNEYFKISYRRLFETGAFQREKSRWLEMKPACLAHVDFVELSLRHVLPAFMLFGTGLFLSTVLLLFERIHKRFTF